MIRGDVVTVVMARNNIFPWQKAPAFEAIFRHLPRDTGDALVVVPSEATQVELRLNPNSADFIAIWGKGRDR